MTSRPEPADVADGLAAGTHLRQLRNLNDPLASMQGSGFGGHDAIALTLASAGWKVSARSVRRILARAPRPSPVPPDPPRALRPVIARFVHHVWMITDLGGEFRGRGFARAARRLGIQQRFASASKIHATARLEPFWRTLKDATSLRLHRPLSIQDLERRVEIALAHYLLFRPHQGLHGATPAEAFLGVHPACAKALSPPRRRPGEESGDSPFCVEYLDPHSRRFPVLKSAA